MIDFQLPQITGRETQAQLREIKAYLFQLSEQLRFALGHLDEENFTPALQTQYRAAVQSAQKAGAEIEALAGEIVRNASQIRKDCETSISESEASILASVRQQYLAQSDRETLRQELLSSVDLSAEALDASFSRKYSTTFGDLLAETKAFSEAKAFYQTNIRLDAEGIHIRKAESPFEALFTNDRLAFLQNGVEVAYISDKKLHITEAGILDGMTVGVSGITPVYRLAASPTGLNLTKEG